MRSVWLMALAFCFLTIADTSAETAKVGSAAPDFTLNDSDGKPHTLAEYRGKVVVLEWFNPECPFVKKHYLSGSMQKTQMQVTSQGGVWLTINSSAEGKQGHLTPELAKESTTKLGINSTALLLDSEGVVGKLYGARTTPHVFVISKDGVLAYAGAIDDKPSTDSSDIATSKNYVLGAVEALNSGKVVSPSSTEPYGCGVKYK